jgi:hypothetical protein
MDLDLIIVATGTLFYILNVCVGAWMLSKQSRPYPTRWSAIYLCRIARLRRSLFISLLIVAPNTVLFLIPLLLQVGDRHLAAMYGGIDLLCSIVLYVLWKWTRRLIIMTAQYADTTGKI